MRVPLYVQYDNYWRGPPAVLAGFKAGMHNGGDNAPAANACLSPSVTAEPAGALRGQKDCTRLWTDAVESEPSADILATATASDQTDGVLVQVTS